MKIEDLVVGRTYRAKKPLVVGDYLQYLNDRTIIWMGVYDLQYDGPAVKNGAKYPSTTKEKFASWAFEDVTDKLPEGDYEEVSR